MDEKTKTRVKFRWKNAVQTLLALLAIFLLLGNFDSAVLARQTELFEVVVSIESEANYAWR